MGGGNGAAAAAAAAAVLEAAPTRSATWTFGTGVEVISLKVLGDRTEVSLRTSLWSRYEIALMQTSWRVEVRISQGHIKACFAGGPLSLGGYLSPHPPRHMLAALLTWRAAALPFSGSEAALKVMWQPPLARQIQWEGVGGFLGFPFRLHQTGPQQCSLP